MAPLPAWLLAAAVLLLAAASLMVSACEHGGDGARADGTSACAAHRAPAGCCAGVGGCAMRTAMEAPPALLPAPTAAAAAAAAYVPDVTAAWPVAVSLAPPSAVVPASGAPPALEGVVLLS